MTASARLGGPVPVLRVQRWEDAAEFYLDHLGFEVLWQHRFSPELPLYLRLQRDEAQLDLSEHHGDGTPGTVVWIPVAGIEALHEQLLGSGHDRSRPGIDHTAPGGPTIEVIDPCDNVLRFCGTARAPLAPEEEGPTPPGTAPEGHASH